MKKMKKTKLLVSGIIILLLIVLTNKVQADTATVSTDTLNLRSEASTSSAVVALLNSGDKLDIISETGNWYKVKYNGKEGYVSKDYVKVSSTGSTGTTNSNTNSETTGSSNNTTGTTTPSGTTTGETANGGASNVDVNSTIKLEKDTTVKILPLINSNTISTVSSGTEVTVISKTNRWIFIQTDEIAGWIVNTDEISKIQNSNTSNNTKNNTNNEDNNNDSKNSNDSKQEEKNSNSGSNDSNEDNQDNNEDDSKNQTSSDTKYSQTSTKYINVSSAYVRSKPSKDGEIVTSLIKNTDVTVTGENGDWYKIKFNNYEGYIFKELLSDSKLEETNRSTVDRYSETNTSNEETESESQTSALGEQIVAYAKQYLGCPYVYGAAGSSSFDCSGFTMYVYKHFGYELSHSATAQSKKGTYVAKEDLMPGDLVFFLDYETMDGIGHCGIYIGDGNFIHASSGSGYCVKVSTLTSGSYAKRYSTARRLI